MGCYIAPDNASTIEAFVADIGQWPHRADILVDGDFNANLAAPEGKACDKEISAALFHRGSGRNEQPFPPMLQTVVEGWAAMVHAPRGTGGALPE